MHVSYTSGLISRGFEKHELPCMEFSAERWLCTGFQGPQSVSFQGVLGSGCASIGQEEGLSLLSWESWVTSFLSLRTGLRVTLRGSIVER